MHTEPYYISTNITGLSSDSSNLPDLNLPPILNPSRSLTVRYDTSQLVRLIFAKNSSFFINAS